MSFPDRNNPYLFDAFLQWRQKVDYYSHDPFIQKVVKRYTGEDWADVDAEARRLSAKASFRWRDLAEATKSSGHRGSDYLTVHRLVSALRTGTYPDIDVYDAAAWSCIVGLSETSARNRSKPVDFPDFTRGAWKTRSPIPLRGA